MTIHNQKGQGLTEYGIILLFIMLVGVLAWSVPLRGNLNTMYSSIYTKLQSIMGTDTSQDVEEVYTQIIDGQTVHFTSLTYNGYTLAWHMDGQQRVYDFQNMDTMNKRTSNLSNLLDQKRDTYAVNNGDGTYSLYFQLEGTTYVITHDDNNPAGTAASVYTGTITDTINSKMQLTNAYITSKIV